MTSFNFFVSEILKLRKYWYY